jgi:hemolysin III
MPGWLRRGRTLADEPVKPFLRGRLHQFGFFAFAIFGTYAIMKSKDHIKKMAFYVYLMSTLCLYATSFTLHTIHWHNEKLELWIQKLDHTVIIVQIAGTYTPVCLCNMPQNERWPLFILASVWNLTLVGAFKAIYWDNPPKIFNVAYYFLTGLSIIPYMPKVIQNLPLFEWGCFLMGGIIYLYGGLTYGLEWPDPNPKIFGFHEIFHLCTVMANLCFFIPITYATISSSQS